MKAMVLTGFGGIENFAIQEVPTPVPGKGEVLIKVLGIGIDVIDIKSRKGEGMTQYTKKQNPVILGWDVSGMITQLGEGVKEFSVGDEVFGCINFPGPGCSYAEFAVAPAGQLARKPSNLTHAEAAAATQSPLTAWQALVDNGQIKKGDNVLIHGGAGGVGNYAVQIAHHLGCYVVTTASTADMDFLKSLGADVVIDYKTQKFEDLVSGIDFILDTVGGENFVRSLKVLKADGMIVLLPSNKKAEADQVVQQYHVEKNYRHMLVHSDGEDMRHIADMLKEGSMKIHVDKTFTFEQIPLAQDALENGKVKGKMAIMV